MCKKLSFEFTDALLSNISLHYNGNNVVTFNEPIRFADCSVHDRYDMYVECHTEWERRGPIIDL